MARFYLDRREAERLSKMIYSLEALRQAAEQGRHFEFLFFWGHTPPADGSVNQSCLSQWWMADFTVDGVPYCCAEQYMMAGKARLFGDGDMLAKILASRQPKEMKAFGRAVGGFEKEVWESRCLGIVLEANRAKFGQNPALRSFLLGTGDRILVEASPRDRIWGIGMGGSNPDALDPRKWRGKNRLGFVLTQVRDEMKGES